MASKVRGLLSMTMLLAGACGDFVEAGDDRALVTLGTQGGAIEFRELRLDVPAGALARTVNLEVTSTPAGHVSHDYHLGPAGVTFDVTTSIAIRYDQATQGPANELFILDLSRDPLHPLPGRVVEAQEIRAHVSGAGRFAVVRCPRGVCGQ